MEAKRLLRSRLVTARAARPPTEIAAAASALAGHGVKAWSALATVTAYASVGSEPPTRELLDRLRAAGVRVLLPVVTGAELRWAPYDGWDALVAGPLGLLQPAGAPASGDPVAAAGAVVVPALAVDGRGRRLGRGGGYFDRALATVGPERVVAVIYDDEVLDEVPAEPHDRPVGAVLTPAGLRRVSPDC